LGGAAERRLGDFLLGVAARGGGAVRRHQPGVWRFRRLCLSPGVARRVVAALIVCAAFGATAITIWAVAMARRRARRSRLAAMASASASVEDLNSILRHLVTAGAQQDQLAAAMRLGRELSPMQLFALALVGGFIAGRKLAK